MNQTDQRDDTPNIAFIKARWHADIVDRCQEGFLAELDRQAWRAGNVEVYEVPGSFEIPLLAKRLALTGRFAAVVASGFVVDGGIYRHDFVAGAVIDALMRVQLDTGVPVITAVLMPHHFHDHGAHREFFAEHFVTKGKEAADACLKIMTNSARLAAVPSESRETSGAASR
jgi:6,7-dimethyl-8-ribityllumazine synthase